jgi:DNA-directed RNA polymerase specialized sigma24 family protein
VHAKRVLPFEEFVQARGAGLVRLAYALCGNERPARELALEALVRARRQWARIQEQPEEPVEQELVQAYLSWWRRPRSPRADHPLATLTRTERAVLVLRHYRELSASQVADAIGRSGATVRRHLEAHEADKDSLTEFVEAMYPPDGLLGGIAAKQRALSRRRTAIGGGIAVLVLATAGVFGATRPATPVVLQTPPFPVVSATTAAAPMEFFPVTFPLPAFPYEPTYLPRDPGPSRVYKTPRDFLLEYSDISLALAVREPGFAGTPELIKVQGKQAKVFSGVFNGNTDISIVWPMESQWITVHTFNIPLEETKLIADGIRPGRIAMDPPPFTITLAPQGFNLIAANPERICIGRGNDIVAGAYGLCVNLAEPEGLPILPANHLQRTTINGLRVEVADFEGVQSELRLFLADGRVLVVAQNALTPNSKLNADELVRFATAIQISPPPA